MLPTRYPSHASRLGLLGRLLRGIRLAWFVPLLKNTSIKLNYFKDFIKELKACFGDMDNIRAYH